MDTIKENKSLEDNQNKKNSLVDKEFREEKSESLTDLFDKYKVEQYFWRNYKEPERIKSLALILFVSVSAIILSLVLFKLTLG